MKLLLLAALFSSGALTYGYIPTSSALYFDSDCTRIMTSLPATYFVVVLEGDETGGAYKVSYKDITGYIKGIELVDYEPVTKFAAASFRVKNDGYPAKLRSAPSDDAEVVAELPPSAQGYYYGDAEGKALIESVGGLWHYVSYDDGTTKCGYVYSSQVEVSKISPNVIEKVERNDKGEDSSSPVENSDFLLIACLCVPAVLIMYLAFREKSHSPRFRE